jgi:hypothetical protein
VTGPGVAPAFRSFDHQDFRAALALAQNHCHRRPLENYPQPALSRPMMRENMFNLL